MLKAGIKPTSRLLATWLNQPTRGRTMLYRRINIVVAGLFLVLALPGVAANVEGEASSGLTMSAVWSLFGYPRTAELQQHHESETSESGDEVVHNPLYEPEAVAANSGESEAKEPAPTEQPSPAAASIAPPVQPTESALQTSSALANTHDNATPNITEQTTIRLQDPAINMELFASRIEQFSQGNQAAYLKANEAFLANKKNPLVYYITKQNPEDFWLGLINFGLDNSGITSLDLMWIIHEYARPYNINKQQAEKLFKHVIVDHLSGSKSSKIIDLVTSLSIQPTNSWTYTYDNNDRFSVLANMMELGYTNAKYTEAFKYIINCLPAEKVDVYESVKLHVKNETASYNLVSWLLKDKAHYVVKKHDYAVLAAQHLFTRRLAALASDKPDLHGDIVALATVLLRERLMTDAEYAKASTRFIK